MANESSYQQPSTSLLVQRPELDDSDPIEEGFLYGVETTVEGASTGGSIGGPWGALVGALVGTTVGQAKTHELVDEWEDYNQKQMTDYHNRKSAADEALAERMNERGAENDMDYYNNLFA